MIVGYDLIKEQKSESIQVLKNAGCKRIYIDLEKAPKGNRRYFKQALADLREGDILIVRRLDRLEKTISLLVRTIYGLAAKGVEVKSLEEDFSISKTRSSEIIGVLKTLTLFEENALQLRKLNSLETIKKNNSKQGRPKQLQEKELQAIRVLLSSHTVSEICARLGISRTTYYKYFPSSRKKTASAK
jgi:DNA invertase Pin-like site-specific DNA recombinase